MGASAQKKKRQELKSSGVDSSAKKLTEQELKAQKFRRNTIIVIVAFVIFAILVAVFSSNLLYNGVTAVKVGDMKFSAADYGYFYGSTYNNYYNSYYSYYGEYASYFMPTEDVLKSDTLAYMKEIAMLYAEAQTAGYTLDEDALQEIETTVAGLETTASTYGYNKVDKYLAAVYGKGMNVKIFRENLTMAMTATRYAQSVRAGFEVTEADMDTYYAENKDDLDLLTFRYLYIDGSEVAADEEAGIEARSAEESMAWAKNIAEQFKDAVTTEAQFMTLAEKLTDAEGTRFASFGADIAKSVSENCATWLLDESRAAGDIGIVEEETGYYVMFFVDRDDNDYETVNVRHILVRVTDDVDDQAAKTKAEEIYQEWLDGDATEESFAALAEEYSDDTAEGGLYENVYKNQMVSEFNEWCYDSSRKAGDVEIVKSEDYGYHIIYFIGDGENYKAYTTENGVRDDLYLEWVSEREGNYTISSNWVLAYAR